MVKSLPLGNQAKDSWEKQQRPPSRVAVSYNLLLKRYAAGVCVSPYPVAYQRARLVSRRGSRGFASLTFKVRPPSSLPWSP